MYKESVCVEMKLEFFSHINNEHTNNILHATSEHTYDSMNAFAPCCITKDVCI